MLRRSRTIDKIEPSIDAVVRALLFDHRARINKAERPPLKLIR